MGRTITKAVALGILPFGFSVLAYLTVRELLFWPRLGAKLWAVAAWLLVVGVGYELCRRFFEAGDRKCQPREVGGFLGRLLSLHALAALGMVVSYFLAAQISAGHWYDQWLCYASALLGGSLSLAIFLWILFATKDPHRGGRRLLEGDELKREAEKLERELRGAKDAPVFFAGHWLPFKDAVDHFLVMGATNTGKTLVQRMLMQSALRTIGLGLDQRAVVFNAKQDVLSILAGMNLKCPVVTLDPFDARGCAWDMAADITTRLDAQTLAENLVPIDEHATQKFFDEAVRSLYEEVIVTFQKTAPGDWTFRDVILAMRDRRRLTRVLKRTMAGRDLLRLCFANEETAQNVMATVNNRTKPYQTIASSWQWASDEGRTVSLTKWLSQESILVLGNSHTARPAIQAVNQVLFTRLAQLILNQSESRTRRNWMFLDEVRQAGRLARLTDLMVEGRSKGACVVLGFQDMEGMMYVHTPHLARELVGQAHNVCITKLINPETAELASRMFGEYEAIEEDESVTKSQGGGRSRTVSAKLVRRQAVMASEFMNIPMPSPKTGLTFYALTSTRLKAYHETMPGKVVASMLCPANPDPARGGMCDSEPVPDERQELRPWDAADYARLRMSPPRNPSAKERPKNEPREQCEQRRKRDKLRVIKGGKKEPQTRSG
jgi:type IV secretory pathway TraG/TraD family ATPase VirD4